MSFENMQAILLHWSAVQNEITTSRLQKFGLFYRKFTAEFTECSFTF